MLQQKASKFEVKESNDDSRIIKGYASVFNNLDSDSDVIQKGAFTKTIKERGPEGKKQIKLVSQHNMGQPVGVIKNLYEDDKGLYMEAKFGTHTAGEDHYRMAKEGILDEFSVGFVAEKKEENNDGGYDIKEIKLYEVSLVTVAANEEAVVTEVKSDKQLEEVEKLAKQVEDEDLAFKLEKELLKLKSALLNESTTEPTLEEKDTQPELEEKDDKQLDILTQLKELM